MEDLWSDCEVSFIHNDCEHSRTTSVQTYSDDSSTDLSLCVCQDENCCSFRHSTPDKKHYYSDIESTTLTENDISTPKESHNRRLIELQQLVNSRKKTVQSYLEVNEAEMPVAVSRLAVRYCMYVLHILQILELARDVKLSDIMLMDIERAVVDSFSLDVLDILLDHQKNPRKSPLQITSAIICEQFHCLQSQFLQESGEWTADIVPILTGIFTVCSLLYVHVFF